MDKQKQIEEMAKEVEKSYTAYRGFCPHKPTVCSTIKSCVYCNIATHLIEQGYRKITEGAVVLTREELEERDCKNHHEGYKTGVAGMQEQVEALHKVLNERKAEVEKYVRKETAEKFAEMYKELLDKQEKGWSANMIWIITAKNCIDEICKEITEGKV